MEIRKTYSETMDDTPSEQPTTESARAPSPCDSEISVGCEDRTSDRPPSPMETAADTVTEDEDPVNSPQSHFSRDDMSPRTMSPESGRCSDSYSYLSEDEYFRPLKRLAMSDASPNGGPMPVIPFIPVPREASIHSGEESDRIPRLPTPEPDAKVCPEEQRDTSSRDANAMILDKSNAGLRSFSIMDILSYKPSRRKSSIPMKIVRPWDSMGRCASGAPPPKRHHESARVHKRSAGDKGKGGALDALFKMTNSTLDNLNKEDKADAVNLFNNRQTNKKKRKSRTAFTNTQIFELEKRFLYQKYLSPADRDELAQTLGLSNAQVITWFQNRRAKLKRDMEEMKRDVEQSSVIHCNKAFMEASANVMAFIKSKDLPKIPIPTLPR